MANADRPIDIAIFGATGFTGERVVLEVARIGYKGNVAIAGRSKTKLEAIAAKYKVQDKVKVIIADVANKPSLLQMAASSRIVLNCVGPYRLYGEPVVKACVEAGAHYLDVSGEPEFIEGIEFKYFETARSKGVYVASAAGFDSIPADVGTLFAMDQFAPPAVCQSVTSFLTLTATKGMAGHYATYQSAVLGVANAGKLGSLRRQLEGKSWRGSLKVGGPRMLKQSKPYWEPRMNAWALPFPGSDASVVRRTQQLLSAEGRRPVQYAAYFTLPTLWSVIVLAVYATIFGLLTKYKWGRSLLLRYPKLFSSGIFSHEGPTEEQLKNTFFQKTFIAQGYSSGPPSSSNARPDMTVRCHVKGPEPGYVATPLVLVQAALTVLENGDQLGPGGVYTVAYLLRNTDIVLRMQQAGLVIGVESAGPKA